MPNRRQVLTGACAAGIVGMPFVARRGFAQPGPRPTRFVFAYGAGGAGDGLARVLASKMGDLLNGATIVENKPGASGRIGTKAALTTDPDGTTLLFSPIAPISMHPSIYPVLDYNPLTDAAPIAQLVTYDVCCVTNPALKLATMADFVAWLKANPDKASCAMVGAGGIQYFLAGMLAKLVGVEIRPVYYRGNGAIMNDLTGGQVPFSFCITSDATELHKAGKVRIIATSGSAPSPLLNGVPTFKQAGYDLEGEGWYGLFAPAKVPAAKLAELEKAALAVLAMSDVREKALGIGFTPTGVGAADFAKIIRTDLAKWAPIIKDSGYKPAE